MHVGKNPERAIMVCHVAYRTAESGGWFRCGMGGWQWLIPWASADTNKRNLQWLVTNGWVERRQLHAQEGGLDRAEWRLGPTALPFFTQGEERPHLHAERPHPTVQNAPTPSGQIAPTPSGQNAGTENAGENTQETTVEKTPPNPPKGVSSTSPKPSKAKATEDQWDHLIPLHFQTDEFREAWHRWCRYRIERRKPITETTAVSQIRKMQDAARTPAAACEWIAASIEAQWSGIFPPPGSGRKGFAVPSRSESDEQYRKQNGIGGDHGDVAEDAGNPEWFDQIAGGSANAPA